MTIAPPAADRLQSGKTLALAVAPVAAFPDASDTTWRRLLSAAEIAYCTGLERAGEHLVARALARRVVAEALGWTGDSWPDIVISRAPSGRPSVALRAELAAWQRRHQLPVPGLSLSHAGGYASALAWLPATAQPDLVGARLSGPLAWDEDGR